MMKLKTLAALATLTAATVAHAGNDIAGVQLGSSYASARPLLLKANPGYKFTDITLTGGKVVGTNAAFEKGGKVVDQFIVIQNAAGQVWYAARGQAFDQGGRIKTDTLKQSLVGKYGKFSRYGYLEENPLWEFDRAGKLWTGSNYQGPCGSGGIPAGGGTDMGRVSGANIHVPTNFPERCGVMIKTAISHNEADKMVSAFSVMMVDSARMYDELNGNKQKAEAERVQKLKRESAQDIKPQL